MDYGNGIAFVSNDKGWVGKLAIAGLLMVSIIGIPAVMGWMMDISRRAAKDEEGLPDWSEMGEYYLNGLTYFVITGIWVLPFFILTIGLGIFLIVSSNLDIYSVETKETTELVLSGLYLLGIGNILFAILLSVPLIGLIGEGHSALKLANPMHAFRLFIRNIGKYFRVMIMGWIGSIIMLGIGLLTCGLGVLIGGPYGYAYFGYLIGKVHAVAVEDLDVRLNDNNSSDKQDDIDEIPPAI